MPELKKLNYYDLGDWGFDGLNLIAANPALPKRPYHLAKLSGGVMKNGRDVVKHNRALMANAPAMYELLWGLHDPATEDLSPIRDLLKKLWSDGLIPREHDEWVGKYIHGGQLKNKSPVTDILEKIAKDARKLS
jgi:hypothetical protein